MSLRKTTALPLTQTTAMYKPRIRPDHRWTWKNALRSQVVCGRRNQRCQKDALAPSGAEGWGCSAVEIADGIADLPNVPC